MVAPLIADCIVRATRSTIWNWLVRLGGPGLILLGLADNSAVPLPGSMDVFTVLLSAHNRSWWPYYASMATVGAVIGGYITYRLAEKGGEETLEKKVGKEKAQTVYRKFERQGNFWIFLGAVLPPPFPIVPVLMAAGIMEFPKRKFLAMLALGRSVRYFALAWIAHIYGVTIIGWLSRYYQPLLHALIALAVLGAVGAVIYFAWYLPRKRRQEQVQRQSSPQKAASVGDDAKAA
jgi:membrane protein YqaA with SNARE-associated domain